MAVKHVRLGNHGALVSNLCLGTMNFGWVTSEEDSFRIMDRALELGINFFDTADVYGWTVQHGTTEEIIGRWFAQGGGRRDAVVLATKVYNPVTRKGALPEPNSDGRSLSAYKIRKHCEGSLKRMQTDWIDLYQMHHIDRACPWDETWQAFGALVNQGKVEVFTDPVNIIVFPTVFVSNIRGPLYPIRCYNRDRFLTHCSVNCRHKHVFHASERGAPWQYPTPNLVQCLITTYGTCCTS